MIHVEIERAYYDEAKLVFQDFSLTAEKGEIVAVIGSSGRGKSTLLKIIAGLHTGYAGTRHLAADLKLAFIPQKHCLLPWKTVYQNIIMLKKTRTGAVNREEALSLIERLGLSGFENQYPLRLSGGQYQRVALGQAMFYEPDILLMDEPFSSLDGDTKREVQELFMRMQTERGVTTVFVTHDMEEARYMNGRIVKLP